MYFAGIRTKFKELLDCDPADRVSKIRSKLGKWCEDESTIRISRMGNNKVCGLNLLIAVEEDIKIDGAWPARVIPDSTGFAFNQKTAFQ